MSVDYMRPNFFEDPIQRLKQSRVETRSLAEMPQPNIGPLQPVLDGSVHWRIKACRGNIVRFRQTDHQVAGHLLGAANAERRCDVQDSKPFKSGHVLRMFRGSRGDRRLRMISYVMLRSVCKRAAASAALPPASMAIEQLAGP